MQTQLKNMGHAALVRSGYALGRAAFKTATARKKLTELEQLTDVDRQIVEVVLRQIGELETEIKQVEEQIIARGKGLSGIKRLLQIHGLNLSSAIGMLVEIGDIEQFGRD